MENMTRKQYMELFNLTEFDAGMEFADEEREATGKSWWEIAKAQVATMNMLLASVKED